MAREDLLDWARDRFALFVFHERKTFSCPSFYRGRTLLAFLYEDGLCIKCNAARARQAIQEDPETYRPFAPGKGIMKNWLLIVHPELQGYEDDWSRITREFSEAESSPRHPLSRRSVIKQ